MKAALFVIAALAATAALAEPPICGEGQSPYLVVHTPMGLIVARLAEAAAPHAVRRVVDLADGPIFRAELFSGREDPPAVGYYDGLTFLHARPHFELTTGVRPPGELIEIENEIDAKALGLDVQLVENAGQAMDIVQREIVPAYKAEMRKAQHNATLDEWGKRLLQSNDAAFLVGVSRQRINEALGYVYREGLASLPVARGSLFLRPLSPRASSARLAIALADLPQLTGRTMVIGQIVEGLDIAEAISVLPLADPSVVQDRHQPQRPITIEKVRHECRPTPH